MATEARIGYGTLFQTGNGASPEVFTNIAEVFGITPPSGSRDSIDVSHGESPDGWREFIGGMKDPGEVSFEMNFVPGGDAYLALVNELDLQGQAITKNRRVVFPDNSRLDFPAFLMTMAPEAPLDDRMIIAVTFKVSGKPVLTQA